MNVSYRQDTSYLFNSLNSQRTMNAFTGVSGLASLVSDYNTIKNGSYNKLVKAYYNQAADEETTVSGTKKAGSGNDVLDKLLDKTRKTDKEESAESAVSATTSKEYSQISSDAADVRDAVRALSPDASTGNIYRNRNVTTKDAEGKESTTWGVDREAINSAVSKYVDSYNALIKSGSDASNTTVSSRISSLTRTTSSFGGQLRSIGITANTDGTLSLDKDKLSAADTNEIKTLFGGVGSYGDKVDSAATMIKSGAASAASATSTYNAQGAGNVNYASSWNTSV